MGRDSISVVMATYNGETFLREQIDSLTSQSRIPDEIIIADDASKDSTVAIAREFARTAPCKVILIERETNVGYPRNFSDALTHARGDYIFLSDQDDIWITSKIETIADEFRKTSSLLVSHDFRITNQNNQTIIESYYEAVRSMNISPAIVVHGCALAFRRELLQIAGFPTHPQSWTHDTWLCAIATALNSRSYLSIPLINHRIHGQNTSGWFLRPKTGFKKWLYKTGFPPFTTSSDLDCLLEFYAISPVEIAEFEARYRLIAAELRRNNLESVVESLTRRAAMFSFSTDKRYNDPWFRVRRCASLLQSGAYRTGGRLPGLVRDILGQRA
jgi:glycosyltransferase involved in cell wall biosynthesis